MSINRTTYLIKMPVGVQLVAEFRWTVSRGRDTYGYNICSLWLDGSKVSSCNGGGYDMQGTAFADWLQKHAQDRLRKLQANFGGSTSDGKGFYGLSFWNTKTKKGQRRWSQHCEGATLDGSCGFNSIQTIAEKCGYTLTYIN